MSEPAAVDANVLVYAYDTASPFHAACRRLLGDRSTDLYLAPQVLAEFYSVVTKTNKQRIANPLSPDEALDAIAAFLAQPNIDVLPVPADIITRWTTLARDHPVTGHDIFDLQIAAVLAANDIRRLYTFNVDDFEDIEQIDATTP